MREHFLESSIDGFVYFTANVVAKRSDSGRDLSFWIPLYRGIAGSLVDFVDRLGAEWGSFYARKIGQDVPRFQSDELRMIFPMRLVRTPKRK
jgi:hypothetical protein